jgi:acyl-CoA thioesterase
MSTMTAIPTLAEVTAVTKLGDGRYEGQMHPAWDGPAAPNGGVVAGVMTRAAIAELGRPDLPPRAVTTHYLRPPLHGPAELRATVLRAGRTAATTEVRLEQDGRLAAVAHITSAAPRAAPVQRALAAPGVPAPGDVAPVGELPGAPNMLRRLDLRPTFGTLPFAGGDEPVVGGWLGVPQVPELDAPVLVALTDAWWPALFGVLDGFAGVPTLELTVHLRSAARPVAGPVLARFETATVAEGMFEETGSIWAQDGTLVAESRQLALLVG